MKEAIIRAGPKVEIIDSDIPKAGKNQVVIKVVFSGCNPKDWKIPDWMGIEVNGGDDIAGTVHEVGEGVFGFKVGDRVAAFHEMCEPHGSYAEYALAWDHTTIHLPANISFQEAATLPLASLTSAIGLYASNRLALPPPWSPLPSTNAPSTPVIVYGGATAVGSYAIQLLQRSNIHPIISIAGRGIPHVQSLISSEKGDIIIDYRNKSPSALVTEMKKALGDKPCMHAFDAVSEHGSYEAISEVLGRNGRITLVLPGKDYSSIPEHVIQTITKVGDVHTPEFADFGFVSFQMIARGLREGWFRPHPIEIVKGGLGGVQEGLRRLKAGEASAVKYVYEIDDTEGLRA